MYTLTIIHSNGDSTELRTFTDLETAERYYLGSCANFRFTCPGSMIALHGTANTPIRFARL
jgi:hypothetical protein